MKKITALILCVLCAFCVLASSCGNSETSSSTPEASKDDSSAVSTVSEISSETESTAEQSDEPNSEQPEQTVALKDGTYSALFNTDSSMFHVNEAHHGKGTLTVKDGKMTIHVSLPSKNTLNLFFGTAEDAKAEGAELLMPTTDSVAYEDGITEEVYGFDIPVPYLDKEFNCALIGKKGVWYDHLVSVSAPELIVADGEYTAGVTLKGGSGRATVTSPANITVKDGKVTAEIIWSSSNYEYMEIDGVRYDLQNSEGNSTFLIPASFDREIPVSALTTAMSQPHLIDYVLVFDSGSLEAKSE